MEDSVLQKERPPGQTGTIIDLFGIRRLHSSEWRSGCWWILRESSSVHTAADKHTHTVHGPDVMFLCTECMHVITHGVLIYENTEAERMMGGNVKYSDL